MNTHTEHFMIGLCSKCYHGNCTCMYILVNIDLLLLLRQSLKHSRGNNSGIAISIYLDINGPMYLFWVVESALVYCSASSGNPPILSCLPPSNVPTKLQYYWTLPPIQICLLGLLGAGV